MFFFIHKLVRNWLNLRIPGKDTEVHTTYTSACRSNGKFFCKGVKYLFFLVVLPLLIAGVPFLTITIWKPYELYCLSRLDTAEAVPSWCWDSFPNLYQYI